MKESSGSLGSFLNEVTQKAENQQENSQIIYLDIEEIETNPQNFYGLRNIDELAGLIAVSHLIEPLTVSKISEGKYKIISGHRRRAAVQKLLEEGIYTERKLPCIVKTREKLKIEQENGETIEFDENAVEMLNLIASNRGQREERTIDEKIQEVKYLEKFAKAIYNQKNNRRRGRFLSFFAEEILNISQTQLWRMNSLEKLTENVRQAIDDKKISETAAAEMSSMTEEKQEECLEKILTGEMKGTVQAIQQLKSSPKIEIEEESPEEKMPEVSEDEEKIEESTINNIEIETESESESETEDDAIPKEELEETAEIVNLPLNVVKKLEKSITLEITDVPEEFEDPQKEAEEWFYQEKLAVYEKIYNEVKRLSKEETDELKASQWGIRASVARYNIEELKLQNNKNK